MFVTPRVVEFNLLNVKSTSERQSRIGPDDLVIDGGRCVRVRSVRALPRRGAVAAAGISDFRHVAATASQTTMMERVAGRKAAQEPPK